MNNDVIRFSPNFLSGGNQTIHLASEIAITSKVITIKGLYNNSDTLFISGQGTHRIFNVNIGWETLTLDSLSFINGYEYKGGAIYFFESSKIIIKNCYFYNNVAINGGGALHCETSAGTSYPPVVPEISNSTFKNNSCTSGYGGAISYLSPTFQIPLTMNNSVGLNNSSSGPGGFIYSAADNQCVVNLTGCHLNNNHSFNGNGGAVCTSSLSHDGIIDARNCIVENNSAENGGAFYSSAPNRWAAIRLRSSIVRNNTASIDGGSSMSYSPNGVSQTQVEKSTIYNNSASGKGGGFYGNSDSWAYMTIYYTTLTNNTAGEGGGAYLFSGDTGNQGAIYFSSSTCYNNNATSNVGNGLYCATVSGHQDEISLRSSIVFNGANNIFTTSNQVSSAGYNILSDSLTGVLTSDQVFADSAQLNLLPLGNYGGSTPTLLPGPFSIAINNGYPYNNERAQNDTLTGIRDVGAAENRNVYQIDNLSSCDELTWVDGVTYGQDTLGAIHTFSGSLNTGFDSIVKLNLDLSYSSFSSITPTVCSDYVSPSGNYNWTTTGVYLDTIPNSVGCDSIITVNLTVNYESQAVFTETVCETKVSPSGNYIWSTSGTYKDTIPNTHGCDSVMTFNLTVNYPNTGTDIITECGSYTWIDGITYTSDNNTATYTLTNQAGCDSVVSLDLTVNNVDNTVNVNVPHLAANVTGASYQWLDCDDNFSPIIGKTGQLFTASNNGSFAVEVTKNGCTDTSMCILIDDLGIFREELKNIHFFPNPTYGKITIIKKNPTLLPFEITDLTGRVIYKGTLSEPETIIDLSQYSKQMYLLRLENGQIIRFVKE